MPWDRKSFKKHNKNAGPKDAAMANAILRKTGNDASAIKITNAAIKRRMKGKKNG